MIDPGLRTRGDGAPVTTAELSFDLVYVFAVTQLSGLILHDLSVAGVVHAAFLLLVVWWAWIYTTWMAVLIALGESIVVIGATAASTGLTFGVVLRLIVAFLETAALWWLYFGGHAERSRNVMTSADDPGRLARDAYTYGHLPIIAGIIATAVGLNLLIAVPHRALDPVGVAMLLGGPVLYLIGESHYRWRISGTQNGKGLTVAGAMLLLAPIGSSIGTLWLSVLAAALLTLLAVWQWQDRNIADGIRLDRESAYR